MGFPPRCDGPPCNRHLFAKRAEDHIQAHFREPFLIADLCRAAGCSRRFLEYAFRETFDMSPAEYVRVVRLNHARQTLHKATAAGVTVAEVAVNSGLPHFGRFSTDYRRLFGESPRETLRGEK